MSRRGPESIFRKKTPTQNQIQLFGLSLSAVVDRSNPPNSLLALKPTNETKHTGGERIKPGSGRGKNPTRSGSSIWRALLRSTRGRAKAAQRSVGSVQPGHLVRRLTHSQYDNTVRDLLGDYSRPAVHFPPEDYVDGFKNQLRYQSMPPLLVDAYSASAEKLALNAFRAGDINHLVPCKPSGAGDVKCRDQFVRTFGARAFRRPLREDEFKRYAAAFSAQATATGKFLEGARTVVEAMLQSPNFLFHMEAGPDGRSSITISPAGSRIFCGTTMPDQALFDAAAKGELRTPPGVKPRPGGCWPTRGRTRRVDEFFDQWLRFDRVLNSSKEAAASPSFPGMAGNMVEETRRLLDHLAWDNVNFMELFTADYAYLSADLASLYKLPAPPGQFELVRFPRAPRARDCWAKRPSWRLTPGPRKPRPRSAGSSFANSCCASRCRRLRRMSIPIFPRQIPSEPLTRRQRMSEHEANRSARPATG